MEEIPPPGVGGMVVRSGGKRRGARVSRNAIPFFAAKDVATQNCAKMCEDDRMKRTVIFLTRITANLP